MFRKKFCWQRWNFKRKFEATLEFILRSRAVKHPPFQDKGLRDIGHKIIVVLLHTIHSFFICQQWLGVHIWFITRLYYKIPQMILQNATAILWQNVTKIQNILGFLLQNAIVLLKNALIHWALCLKMNC